MIEFFGGLKLAELLKTLEGHVVDDVEFERGGKWIHIRISATELDSQYALHETLGSKILSFSIVDEEDS